MVERLPDPIKPILRPGVDEAMVGRIWRGVRTELSSARARRSMVLAWSGAAALVAGALAFVISMSRSESDGGVLRLRDGSEPHTITETQLEFEDGSSMRLADGAVLQTLKNTPRQVAFLLERGRVEINVDLSSERQWWFEAGLVSVDASSREFIIVRTPEHVRIEVAEGSVLVRGERVRDRVQRIAAGAVFEIEAQPVASAVQVPRPMPETGLAPKETPAQAEDRQPLIQRPVEVARAAREVQPPSDRTKPAQPQPQQVQPQPQPLDADALLEEADRARARGELDHAAELLRRIVQDHAAHSSAALAAFTLGRLELNLLDQPGRAAESFARALQLALPAALREDAAAHRATALARDGRKDAASAAAREYLHLYPEGRHRTAMELFAR